MIAMVPYEVKTESLRDVAEQIDELLNGTVAFPRLMRELPADFREAVYREQERIYLLEDAKRHWREDSPYYLLADCPFEPDESDYGLLVDRFQSDYDCNVAENDQWNYHVERLCIEVQGR